MRDGRGLCGQLFRSVRLIVKHECLREAAEEACLVLQLEVAHAWQRVSSLVVGSRGRFLLWLGLITLYFRLPRTVILVPELENLKMRFFLRFLKIVCSYSPLHTILYQVGSYAVNTENKKPLARANLSLTPARSIYPAGREQLSTWTNQNAERAERSLES
jgi:hypothetical protein